MDQVDAEEPQEIVYETILPVVKPLPDHRDGNEWGDIGEEVGCAGKRKELQALVEKARHQQSEEEGHRNVDPHVIERVPECSPEVLVVEDVVVVLPTHEGTRRADDVPLEGTQAKCGEEGIEDEDA